MALLEEKEIDIEKSIIVKEATQVKILSDDALKELKEMLRKEIGEKRLSSLTLTEIENIGLFLLNLYAEIAKNRLVNPTS